MTAPKTAPKTAKATAAEAGAKKPTDHLAKAEAADDPIVRISYDGFDLEFDSNVINDYELLEQANMGAPFRMFDAITGDQKQAVLKHLKGDNPRLGLEVVGEWIEGVFKEINAGN